MLKLRKLLLTVSGIRLVRWTRKLDADVTRYSRDRRDRGND